MPHTFRMHYLVEDPEGPNESGPMPGPLAFVRSNKTRVRAACDPAIKLSELERGTGETYLVVCDACQATEIFKKNYQPHPNLTQGQPLVADGSRPGGPAPCCGG